MIDSTQAFKSNERHIDVGRHDPLQVMHVTEIALRGFESYREEQRVPLERHVTLLAGRNNVGKSALLRGLWAAADPQVGVNDDFRLTVTASAEVDRVTAVLEGAGVPADPLRKPGAPLAQSVSGVFTPGSASGGERYLERTELLDLGWVAEGTPGRQAGWTSGGVKNSATGVSELQGLLREAVRSFRYLAPARIEQGPRSLRADVELSAEARNLTEVVFVLQSRDFRRMQQIAAFMRRSFPEIENITVAPDPSQQSTPMGEPLVFYDGREDGIPLRSCGTGVEAMLRFAVEILTAREPRLFLIDEPQAYLHPHAERELLGLIEEHPQHQYLIATHSHVLLNARPIGDARLVTLEHGATRVTTPDSRHDVLDEVGLTAADLGLAEHLIWVEGPTEEAAYAALLDAEPPNAARTGVVVRRMPLGPSYFSGGRRRARAGYELCRQIARAVRPLPLKMTFLFDRDEKTEAEQAEIIEASDHRATFLPVRELENLFLRVELLTPFLAELAARVNRGAPSADDVNVSLSELLAETNDQSLFPQPPSPEDDPKATVRGSRVLDTLTWDYALTRYDKAIHGRELTELALEHAPDVLEPLHTVLRIPSSDNQ